MSYFCLLVCVQLSSSLCPVFGSAMNAHVCVPPSLCVDLCQLLGGVSCLVLCYQRRSVPAAEKGNEPESRRLGETGR